MAGIKIVDLPALGRDLISTDLLELSLAGGTGSRKITGQEIMNASKLSVGNTPIINGAFGQVLFQGTGNVLQESANFTWDNPNQTLYLGGALSFGGNTDQIKASSGSGNFDFLSNLPMRFLRKSGPVELMRIVSSTGNVLINTTTDAGFRLDVNGAARVKGIGTTVSTTAFTVQDNIGTTYFTIKDDGQLSSSGTDTGIYSNFTTGNKSPLLFSHSGYGTATPNNTRIDIGYRGRQTGGLNSYDFFTYKVYQGLNPTVTTGFEFYTHQNQESSLASQLAMAINGSNVGIGTSSPFGKFDVKDGEIFVTTSTNANLRSRLTYQGLYVSRAVDGTYPENIISNSSAWLYNSRNSHSFFRDGTNLFTVGSALTSLGMNVNSNGNVLIGTTTDAGFRLDVNGPQRILGNLTITAGGSGTNTFNANTNYFSANRNEIYGIVDLQNPAGQSELLKVTASYSIGSGTTSQYIFSLRPNYNFTGTYSGTVRGIYYNPNLISMTGVTHFAFHSTSGRVRFEGLPTSPTGLNAGDIYNDGGTLKIV